MSTPEQDFLRENSVISKNNSINNTPVKPSRFFNNSQQYKGLLPNQYNLTSPFKPVRQDPDEIIEQNFQY